MRPKPSGLQGDPHLLTIPDLFAAQATKTPDATAVTFDQEHITYRELDQASNQLARYLISQGIGPEQIVGILLDRSSQMMISILGILKAGAAYLPLDPNYPAQRLMFMLGDSGARHVISEPAIYQTLEMSETPIEELPTLIDTQDPLTEIQISLLSNTSINDTERITLS